MTIRRYRAVRKYIGGFLLLFIGASVLGSVIYFRRQGGVKETSAPLPGPSRIEEGAQMVTRDFRHVETRMNRTRWILEASVAEIYEETALLKVVKITYYGDSEEPTIITGRRGRINLTKWDAVLRGNVRAVRPDGTVLETARVYWDNGKQILRAPLPVKIRSDKLDIKGNRMIANVTKKNVRITGRVKTVFRPRRGFFGSPT